MIHFLCFGHISLCFDIQETELRYEVDLDSARKFKLRWDIDPATEIVYFNLDVKTTKREWLAFGFSDYGESTDADVIVFWTDPWGKHHFQVSSFCTIIFCSLKPVHKIDILLL